MVRHSGAAVQGHKYSEVATCGGGLLVVRRMTGDEGWLPYGLMCGDSTSSLQLTAWIRDTSMLDVTF